MFARPLANGNITLQLLSPIGSQVGFFSKTWNPTPIGGEPIIYYKAQTHPNGPSQNSMLTYLKISFTGFSAQETIYGYSIVADVYGRENG